MHPKGPTSCETHGESPHAWACPVCFQDLKDDATSLKRQRDHWKANHDHVVGLNAAIKNPDTKLGHKVIQGLNDVIQAHWETIQTLQREFARQDFPHLKP